MTLNARLTSVLEWLRRTTASGVPPKDYIAAAGTATASAHEDEVREIAQEVATRTARLIAGSLIGVQITKLTDARAQSRGRAPGSRTARSATTAGLSTADVTLADRADARRSAAGRAAVTQPGGRSLTAGTALSARMPVARQPATAGARPEPSVNRNAVSWMIDGEPSMSTR